MNSEICSTFELVEKTKRKLISQYVYFTLSLLAIYCIVFYFLLHNTLFACYTISYFCFLSCTWLVLQKDYKIKNIVHLHLLSSSLFVFYIVLCFWKSSIVACLFLVPLPLGAYIFLKRKYIFIYTGYVVLGIITTILISDEIPISYRLKFADKVQLTISDFFVFIYNIFIVSFLLYYKEKIRKLETFDKQIPTHKEIITHPNEYKINVIYKYVETEDEEKSTKKNILLFEKIKVIIQDEGNFKNVDFSISKLSSMMNINNAYLAKAIKTSGNVNYIYYINKCRVDYTKKLLSESDINKVTLMHIYTEAGFSSQSTFNRVFKQIEGITPSEYLKNIILINPLYILKIPSSD